MTTPPSAERPPTALERRSEPVIRWIAALPPILPIGAAVVLVVLGLLLGRVGAVLIGLVAVVFAWFLLVGWRRLTSVERLMRAAVVLLLLAVTLVRALPR